MIYSSIPYVYLHGVNTSFLCIFVSKSPFTIAKTKNKTYWLQIETCQLYLLSLEMRKPNNVKYYGYVNAAHFRQNIL